MNNTLDYYYLQIIYCIQTYYKLLNIILSILLQIIENNIITDLLLYAATLAQEALKKYCRTIVEEEYLC